MQLSCSGPDAICSRMQAMTRVADTHNKLQESLIDSGDKRSRRWTDDSLYITVGWKPRVLRRVDTAAAGGIGSPSMAEPYGACRKQT